jgi:valyl-tRNA synthetase
VDKKSVNDFTRLQKIVTEIRFIKGTLGITTGLNLVYDSDPFIKMHAGMLKSLLRLGSVDISEKPSGLKLQSTHDAWLDLDQKTLQKFLDSLKHQIVTHEDKISNLEKRLSNKSYVDNAPKISSLNLRIVLNY